MEEQTSCRFKATFNNGMPINVITKEEKEKINLIEKDPNKGGVFLAGDGQYKEIQGGGSGSATYIHWCDLTLGKFVIRIILPSSKSQGSQITVSDFEKYLRDWTPYPFYSYYNGEQDSQLTGNVHIMYYPEGPSGKPSMCLEAGPGYGYNVDVPMPSKIEVIKTIEV